MRSEEICLQLYPNYPIDQMNIFGATRLQRIPDVGIQETPFSFAPYVSLNTPIPNWTHNDP